MTKTNILRSPDAEAGTEVDPLAQAAAGWEGRKFPVLAPDRICEFKIISAKKTESKSHYPMAEVVFTTTKDYTGRDGETLRAGYKVYNRIILTAIPGKTEGKKGRTWDQIKDDCLELLTWCGLRDKTARDFANNPSIIEGYVGLAKVGVREETAEFAASNTLRLVLPA